MPSTVRLQREEVRQCSREEIHWSGAVPVTVTVYGTCAAAWYLASPAWLASMVQVPSSLKVTVEPLTEHTATVAEAKVTGVCRTRRPWQSPG